MSNRPSLLLLRKLCFRLDSIWDKLSEKFYFCFDLTAWRGVVGGWGGGVSIAWELGLIDTTPEEERAMLS